MPELLERLQQALADRYRVERELGAGGMATVYLAHDLKHDRPVALKVLRQELAAVLGAERFHREIQIAAKLQHPNILPLLDSGEAGGLLYYVMPFVEGHSLRERLAREGALPVSDAVRILRDVVDALTEAHAHGVVHRDIKPENIMLRGHHALVTDFGVAKAVSEATGRQTLTTAGVALGTPAYMAPEQASADPHLDHRVDIYAVGAVAYELLTGRPVFMGTTPQMVLSAHVTETPAPIAKYRETVPRALEALVMRCLEKQPADRWQSAEELLPQLEALATPSGGITPTETQPVAGVPGRRRLGAAGVVGAVVALIALGAVAFQLLRPRPLVITVSGVTQVTTERGVEYLPAISPDGKEVAYVAGLSGSTHLVVRGTANVAGSGEVRLTDSSLSARVPSWSPDGDAVRFVACQVDGTCAWSSIAKLGGTIGSSPLPPKVQRFRWTGELLAYPAWAPDGRAAFVQRDTILVVAADDTVGHPVAVHPAGYHGLHSLAWSPDGRQIAYVNGNVDWLFGGNVDKSEVWAVAADGGMPRQVAGEGFLNVSPAWLDARHLLFVSDRDGPRAVYVVEVGPAGRRGEPRLVPGIADPHSITYSIGSRTIAFSKFTLQQNIWSYPLGLSRPVSVRDGQHVTSGNLVIEEHDLSPDGRWLVFDSKRRGNMDIYKMPVAGGEPTQLTSLPGNEFRPRWSPDGKEIVFYAVPPGEMSSSVMVIPAEGGAPSAVLGTPGTLSSVPVWSPSGREIVFQSNRGGKWGFWLVSRDSAGAPWHDAVQLTDDLCGMPVWAPDGSGVLCDAGRDLVFISRQGRVLRRRNLIPAGGFAGYGAPTYSRDGRTIYVFGWHADHRTGIWAIPVAGGSARLVVNFDDPNLTVPGVTFEPARADVGRDRLYLTVSDYESDIWVAKLKY